MFKVIIIFIQNSLSKVLNSYLIFLLGDLFLPVVQNNPSPLSPYCVGIMEMNETINIPSHSIGSLISLCRPSHNLITVLKSITAGKLSGRGSNRH